MASTLLLDTKTWDLIVDAAGNIAQATAPYQTAQDAASECRLFLGEAWYDTTRGIPYFQTTLGKPANLPLLRSQLIRAALLADGADAAKVYFKSLSSSRLVTGQIQVTTNVGTTLAVGF